MASNILPLAQLKLTFENKGTPIEQQGLLGATLRGLKGHESTSGILNFYANGKADIYLSEIDTFLCAQDSNTSLQYPNVQLYQFEKRLLLPELSLYFTIKTPAYFLKVGNKLSKSLLTQIDVKHHPVDEIEIHVYGDMEYLLTDNVSAIFDLNVLNNEYESLLEKQ